MAQEQGEGAGGINLARLTALGLPPEELAVLVRSAREKAALIEAGVEPDQLRALEAHRKAQHEQAQSEAKDKAKRLKDLGGMVDFPKAGPEKLDHWECVTFLEHVKRWRDAPEHMKDVDDDFFVSILLNHLKGHPHQAVSSRVSAIHREHTRAATWADLQAILKGEYYSKTPEKDNRMAFYKAKWEQGSLSEFVSHYRVLLTRCQEDGQFLGVSQLVACDMFQQAIAQHSHAREHLRRNEGANMAEWERIDDLLHMAQATYGHLMMHPDSNKRPRPEGGRFGAGRGDHGGRFGPGRGRGGQGQQREAQAEEGQQRAQRDEPHLSTAAKEWYRGQNRCFRCGAVGHPSFRCRSEKAKLAHELPGQLRSECDRGLP